MIETLQRLCRRKGKNLRIYSWIIQCLLLAYRNKCLRIKQYVSLKARVNCIDFFFVCNMGPTKICAQQGTKIDTLLCTFLVPCCAQFFVDPLLHTKKLMNHSKKKFLRSSLWLSAIHIIIE